MLEISIDTTRDQEKDNDNDEYYVPIRTRSVRILVKPNRFGQATEIALGLITCQCNALLKTSQPGSIETIKNEFSNVSIFKSTMDQIDLII